MVKRAGVVRRNHPEDDEMRQHVAPAYGQVGFDCYMNSTRVNPVGVTPGIADVEVFAPALGFRFVHEVKIGHDRQSHAQKLYQERCDACGVAYVLGDREAAEDFLVWFGLAWWAIRGQPQPGIDPATLARPLRVYRLHVDGPGKLARRSAVDHWQRLAGWHTTDAARAQRERWGWKATPGALRKLIR